MAFPAVKDIVLIDFVHTPRKADGTHERGYEYSFGDWQMDKAITQVFRQGLIINLAGSKGGMGENSGLDFRKHTRARISFVIGNRNKAESFSFSLSDSDGTDQAWDIPLKDLGKGTELNQLIDLTKPAREDKPGKKPGLDLKKLKTWQIKGNYQEASIELLIKKVTAVSE
jgi:hypothetical protein